MSESQFLLPDVGEGLTEAEIVSWKVTPGEPVAVNQVIVEIETAKSLVELPSPFEGTVGALLVSEGQTVEVGTPIITVTGGEAAAPAAPVSEVEQAEADAAQSVSHEEDEPKAGAVLVETVFAWPGLGQLTVQAILARDFMIVQGVVLLGAFVTVLLNLLTDLLYSLVDPRIVLEGAR